MRLPVFQANHPTERLGWIDVMDLRLDESMPVEGYYITVKVVPDEGEQFATAILLEVCWVDRDGTSTRALRLDDLVQMETLRCVQGFEYDPGAL